MSGDRVGEAAGVVLLHGREHRLVGQVRRQLHVLLEEPRQRAGLAAERLVVVGLG